MSKVVIIKCTTYEEDKVYEALVRGLDLIGGIARFVEKNERILLKPNMLSAKEPDKHVTTHPTVLSAIIKVLLEQGYEDVVFGDSPAVDKEDKAARINGLFDAADKYGVEQVDFSTGQTVSFPQGRQCQRFEVADSVIKSNAIISLSKMKTHQLTRITGAIKNQLGCVYGLNKAGMHASFPNAINFSKMLVDLNLLLKPRLYIMDGIIAMEGNGPGSGDPRPMNVLLISDDPVAIDATFCKMIKLKPEFIPTITFGKHWGLGEYKDEKIEYLGDSIEEFITEDFDVVRAPVVAELPKATSFVRYFALRKPYIVEKDCIMCNQCVRACPAEPKALLERNGLPPKYEYSKCIRCYCCQETCPEDAIRVKTPLLGKLFFYR
jgi:uncharacterized protein (DUF362 family)/NAD-dependent dihydropyrimidine dehydrogenase PreA subunit